MIDIFLQFLNLFVKSLVQVSINFNKHDYNHLNPENSKSLSKNFKCLDNNA
jgi:hypothetical protein